MLAACPPPPSRRAASVCRESAAVQTIVTRRALLQAGASAAAIPFVGLEVALGKAAPTGTMVLAWHTNIAPRWLDPQQHDGGATPDNFLNVVHDALIKNFREKLYDH